MNRNTWTYPLHKGSRLLLATLLVALALAVGPARVALASTYTVTKTADTADGACNADCSLREAIIAANAHSGSDAITVPAGVYTLSIAGASEDASATGDLDIIGNLTINGANAATTIIDGADLDRIFDIRSGSVTIKRVTVRNGRVHVDRGGGIRNNGTLTLTKCIVSSNWSSEDGGGGLANYSTANLSECTITANDLGWSAGGGIYNAGTLTVEDSTFTGNVGLEAGGALFNATMGTATITGSSFVGNSTYDGGGGAIENQGTLTVTDSEVRDGQALLGGAITNWGTLTLNTTTLSGNSNGSAVDGLGGAIYNSGALTINGGAISDNRSNGSGGGIHIARGQVLLNGVLIADNLADNDDLYGGSGGGIYNSGYLPHNVTLIDTTVSGNAAPTAGGIANGRTMTLIGSTVSDNDASTSGGIDNTGTLTLTASIVSGNSANDFTGGGISNTGALIVTRSSVRNNASSEDGGGIWTNGTLTLTDSTVSGNTATDGTGGGIVNRGMLTVTGSTISGNLAKGLDHGGAGIYTTGTLALTNSTINGNQVNEFGGGVWNSGTLDINNVTIAGNLADREHNGSGDGGGVYNSSGTITIENSIIGGNSDNGGEAPDCGGTLTSQGYNLVQSTAGCTFVSAPGDITGQDPQLAALADNGGATQTRALLPASPAIDTANNATCALSDQRGAPRPQDGNGDSSAICDMGAYEAGNLGTPGNLLLNGGFEFDTNSDGKPDTWSTNSKFTRANTVVHGDSYAGKHASTGNSDYTISQTIGGLAATDYVSKGWVYIPPTGDLFTFKVQVRWRNSSNDTLHTDTIATYTGATSGWAQFDSGVLHAPSGTTNAQVRMVVSDLSTTIYVDDFWFGTDDL